MLIYTTIIFLNYNKWILMRRRQSTITFVLDAVPEKSVEYIYVGEKKKKKKKGKK
jgi:hypothetical protein